MPRLEQVVVVRDDADGDDVVVQRDVPEPAGLALGLDDERGALVAAGVAAGSLPVGPERRLLELRVPVAQAEAIDDERALAAGVDDDLGAHFAFRFVLGLDAHADRLLPLEQHLQHARTFVDIDAMLAGVVEIELVELAAHAPATSAIDSCGLLSKK